MCKNSNLDLEVAPFSSKTLSESSSIYMNSNFLQLKIVFISSARYLNSLRINKFYIRVSLKIKIGKLENRVEKIVLNKIVSY